MILLLCLCTLSLINLVSGCPSRCSCIADTIACKNRGLTTVPTFSAGDFVNVKTLDLSYNNISYLPTNAFPNVHINTLLLNNNRIQGMANDTFQGLTEEIQHIDLSDNRLLTLPFALGSLNKLISMNVSNNYQGSRNLDLTDGVLKALGDTLTEFVFGSLQQRKWPTTLNHLQDLHRLEITSLHRDLTVIPAYGFHGFETTLFEISIHNTNLLAVPLGISNFRNLLTLNYDYNPNTGDRGILLQSFPTSFSSKLKNLSLKGDSLTVFPLVLKYLRHLTKFSIDDNPLDFLSESSIQGLNTLRELSIRNCSLERIPATLATIKNLKEIDFSYNPIGTVEQRDLTGFSNITKLVLSNMPLKYVAHNAFEPLHSIREIVMNKTALTAVPTAVDLTSTLNTVSIGHNKIDCMCETMVWLLHKLSSCNPSANRAFRVIGDCDTIHSTVEDYLNQYVPACPGYKEKCLIPPYNIPVTK